MEEKDRNKEVVRVPRPRGATVLSRTGQYQELENRIIESYLVGDFPYGRSSISYLEFSQLYGVNVNRVKKALKDGVGSSLLLSGDIGNVLEEERIRNLSQSLFRIGTSDRVASQLMGYLAHRVLADRFADPNLVKEMNAAMGNQIRLTEAQLKAVALIHQILNTLPQEAQEVEQETMSREEIMKYLEASPPALPELPEGSPQLRAIPEATVLQQSRYAKEPEIHEFAALKELPIPSPKKVISILPQ
jgi:hypothetical protein